ncbi:GNAT family N-acetyltransferase [Feifania hominis]|uniref:N-acetyltransferase n=1 Tax=Feifania hominis TaxID=2763660 RepID=A0A926DFT0_9FIRM|nr:N-acetyltransferase [Feifania hominis]MBC8537022.1 N-acetyltransferase [Feifania hominis]
MQQNHLVLRRETPCDYRAVEELTREAFWNHFSPGCCEHYLAHILRDSPDFVALLDYVATLDGEIIGSIFYSKASVCCDDGRRIPVLCFGPLSVAPAHQRHGVGSALIEHTVKLARDLGHRAILIYGDPLFYGRLGFAPAEHHQIGTADNMYADSLLALELFDGALAGCSGRFVESGVFELDEKEALAFDRSFAPRTALEDNSDSQRRFRELVQRRRPR